MDANNGTQNNCAKTSSASAKLAKFSFRRKKKESTEKSICLSKDAWPSFISREQYYNITQELQAEYLYTMEQLIEIGGLSAAAAICKYFPVDVFDKNGGAILVCCGPGNNGSLGLVCARTLKMFGYCPTVFFPVASMKDSNKSLYKQCEKINIHFLSYIPTELHLLEHNYNMVIDALFGVHFVDDMSPEVKEKMRRIDSLKIPMISIDVPSGWDVDEGPVSEHSFTPNALISIGLPKLCAKKFTGHAHLLAGNYIPEPLGAKFDLQLAKYIGPDAFVALHFVSYLGNTSIDHCSFDESETTK